ncbi:DNA polymerase III subunit gamma/tau [Halomonas sp. HP20-15]|uniref:DNA polymerase III subunit gamma/tau n=1 Tax=Halomonas sp. HP20-15 TaxID=3085901 RepID=UPI0029811277|nr:DNA polymerase III subunit gamma/tau [Halomonas sp. HP20-15]MDW5376697.1 DNA polymerase III subunit gamma/tau [Halomonas sp. HP20-15]
MSYQVLARKWRPRTFHELVGQEHVQRALINALDQGRLHHAYLFTGTRGVGKTTLARILAKCLNCQGGVTSTPCGQCSTCRDIDDGRFVDLIEVDAASRTKVEDTRELLDNVQYAPSQGRYKVYLIDEVHMLSTHSFNALLKTLEEPPPHVKFLLATTDPQKLPVTVLSRCLQFALKNMPPERIVEHLAKVLEAESVPFEEPALWLLGKAAEGSMRDAMSLTDQAIAFGQGRVQHDDVAAMLGTLDHRHLVALVEALAEVDAARVLAEIASLAEQGPDFAGVLDDLTGILHRLAIAQMVPDALDNGHGDRDTLLALAARFTAEDVQLYYQIGLQGRGDMDSTPEPRTALEMTLLRMLAFRPQGVPKPPQTPLPLRGDSTPQANGEPSPGESTPVEADAGSMAQSSASRRERTSASRSTPDAPSESPQASAGPPASGPVAERPPWETAEQVPDQVPVAQAPAASQPTEPQPAIAHNPGYPEPREEAAFDQADGSHEAAPLRPEGSDVAALEDAETYLGDEYAEPEPSDASEPGEAWLDTGEAAPGEGLASESVVDTLTAPDMSADVALPPDTSAVSADEADVGYAQAHAPAVAAEPGAFDHADWLELFPSLSLSGLTRNLAAHCMVEHDDGQALQLRLDPGQAAMNAEVHVERVRKALAAAGIERRVSIEPAELPGAIETPKSRSDREARERHAWAVEALRGDPHIQELEQAFSARLLEQTVAPQTAQAGTPAAQ